MDCPANRRAASGLVECLTRDITPELIARFLAGVEKVLIAWYHFSPLSSFRRFSSPSS